MNKVSKCWLWIAMTLGLNGLSYAANDGEPKISFNLGQAIDAVVGAKIGPIQDSQRSMEIMKALEKYKLTEDEEKSFAYDQVQPTRAPIYISTDPSSAMAEIKVTRTRPTTITFLDKQGNPYEVEKIIGKERQKSEGDEGESNPRFSAVKLESSAAVVKFSTTVRVGWTTIDIKFRKLNYTIPVKVVAGSTYHSGAQAIVVDDIINRMQDSTSKNSKENQTSARDLTRILSTLANFGPRRSRSLQDLDDLQSGRVKISSFQNDIPSEYRVDENSADDIDVEYMSIDRFDRPKLEIYKAVVGGVGYYLLRTNAILIKPEYVESVPNSSIGQKIWAYAVPAKLFENIISLNYGGGNHIYALKRPINSLGE